MASLRRVYNRLQDQQRMVTESLWMPLQNLAMKFESIQTRKSFVAIKNFSVTAALEQSLIHLQAIRFFRKWHIYS